ncbi:gamma-aminobutyric acid type B receptor subunit 1 isoform X2 [Lingula anatina]|nr:gamma-aminobutyric acid type B receptor subunit 1 isoform X2 [Lingula anatina]|eukprot:XP_023931276.1 gamma-aminobutyric acid type B receptor subunit 1 isoform X2 [Lingula anatina]
MLLLHHGSFTETEVLAEITGSRKMIQISTFSFSASLSDRIKYPYFYRTIGSLVDTVQEEEAFVSHFGWNRVGILSSTGGSHKAMTSELDIILREKNIDVYTVFFTPDTIPQAVAKLKKKTDLRIFLIHSPSPRKQDIMEIFCEVYKQDLYGKNYVWLAHIQRYNNVWSEVTEAITSRKLTCTPQQIVTSMEGTFKTYRMNAQQAFAAQRVFKTGISGEEPHTTWQRMVAKPWFLPNVPQIFYQLSYDTVWAAALAIHNTISRLPRSAVDGVSYSELETVTNILDAELANMTFFGASGPVSFYQHGSRSSYLTIEQVDNGTVKDLGYYEEKTRKITWFANSKKAIWSKHGGAPPKAGFTVRVERRSVSRALRLVYSVIGAIAIILALILIIFTLLKWKTQLIQNSWPLLNVSITFGCIILIVSIILNGYDVTDTLCHASLWLFILGFTVSYGSMLVKMWGVLKFHRGKRQLALAEQLYLLIAVAALVFLDIVLLAVWQATDPQRATWLKVEEKVNLLSLVRQQVYVATCASDSTIGWSIAFFAYKGLMLLMTVFFVWPAWIASLRTTTGDSSHVGVAMVIVVLVSIVGIPVSILVGNQPDIRYGVIGALTLASTIATVLLLLIPKLIGYQRGDVEPTLLSPMRSYVDDLFSGWGEDPKAEGSGDDQGKKMGETQRENGVKDATL